MVNQIPNQITIPPKFQNRWVFWSRVVRVWPEVLNNPWGLKEDLWVRCGTLWQNRNNLSSTLTRTIRTLCVLTNNYNVLIFRIRVVEYVGATTQRTS